MRPYESADVQVAKLWLAALGVAGVVMLCLVGARILVDRLDTPRFPAVNVAAPAIRLSPDPVGELRRYRAAERAKLTGYAWLDRDAGIARIPIDRAIDIVAGLAAAPDDGGPGAKAPPP